MKFLIIFFLAATLAAALEGTLDNSERVIKGTAAADGQFPYQVGLGLTNETNWWTCGGSLISSEWVLTAAHCTYRASAAEVLLGGIYLEKPVVSITVNRNNFIQHEGFERSTGKNDIALIKIPRVNYTDNIHKIELPKNNRPYAEYTGKKVVISGWGSIDDNGNYPDSLLYAEMTVISNEDCYKEHGNILQSHICGTPFNGGNGCHSDSGGPMVLKDSPVLIGVTSFGYKYCEAGLPSVFTRVTSYLDWITEHTGIEY